MLLSFLVFPFLAVCALFPSPIPWGPSGGALPQPHAQSKQALTGPAVPVQTRLAMALLQWTPCMSGLVQAVPGHLHACAPALVLSPRELSPAGLSTRVLCILVPVAVS